HSAAIALLEGALQAVDENVPVLVTVQEMAAPVPFRSVYSSEQPLAVSLLLTPTGTSDKPLARLSLAVEPGAAASDPAPEAVDVDANFSRELIGLLAAAAAKRDARIELELPGSGSVAVTVEASDG
ncbi:MAG: hypothetical protein AAFX10_13280, partial [Pseudomonadota bacterium]